MNVKVFVPVIGTSGTTLSQPSPLFHQPGLSNSNVEAKHGSWHLCASWGINGLMDKSHTHCPGKDRQCPSALRARGLLCHPQSCWVCSGHLPQEQQQDRPQPGSRRWGGPLLLELVHTQPSPHPVPRVCTFQAGSLHPSNLSSPTSLSSAERRCFPRQSCRKRVVTSHFQEDNIHFSSSEHTFFISVL